MTYLLCYLLLYGESQFPETKEKIKKFSKKSKPSALDICQGHNDKGFKHLKTARLHLRHLLYHKYNHGFQVTLFSNLIFCEFHFFLFFP